MCHIWKIVPDLYEAILNLSGDSGGDHNTSIQIATNSTQERLFESNSTLSDDDYLFNSSNYSTVYGKLNLKMNLEKTDENIYTYADLTVSNCTEILRKFGNGHNLNSSTENYSLNNEGQEEAAQQVS